MASLRASGAPPDVHGSPVILFPQDGSHPWTFLNRKAAARYIQDLRREGGKTVAIERILQSISDAILRGTLIPGTTFYADFLLPTLPEQETHDDLQCGVLHAGDIPLPEVRH